MSRKNVIKSYKLLNSVDISTNQTQATPTSVINMDKASIRVNWSGTSPVGELFVEVRNTAEDAALAPVGDWFALDFGSPITISGNSGEHLIIFTELPHNEMRLVYEATSGTGTLTATLTAKQVGG